MTLRQAKMILTYAEKDMNVRSTALELYRSDGSITYQFRKVQEETGRNPQKFYDLCYLVEIAKQVYAGSKNVSSSSKECI